MEAVRSLNEPFGARCFLTVGAVIGALASLALCLNAPFGARCFLTAYGPLGIVVFVLS